MFLPRQCERGFHTVMREMEARLVATAATRIHPYLQPLFAQFSRWDAGWGRMRPASSSTAQLGVAKGMAFVRGAFKQQQIVAQA